jgi:hypothetical protein
MKPNMNDRYVVQVADNRVRVFVAEGRCRTPVLKGVFISTPQALAARHPRLIKALRADAGLTAVVPCGDVMLKPLRLPTQQDAEIRKMVPLMLRAQIPYALKDVRYYVQRVLVEPSGHTRVLVTVIPRDRLHDLVKACTRLKILPRYVRLSAWGLVQWWRCVAPPGDRPREDVVLLVNVAACVMEVCLCGTSTLYYARGVPLAPAAGAWQAGDGPVRDVSQTLRVYQERDWGPMPKRVCVISARPGTEDLKAGLEACCGLPVTCFSPYEGVACSPSFTVDLFPDERKASWAVYTGLLFADGPRGANLIPPEITAARARQKHNRQRAAWVAAVGLLCGLIVAGLKAGVVHQEQAVARIQKTAALQRSRAQTVQRKAALVRRVKAYAKRYTYMPRIFLAVRQAVPEGLWLTAMRVDPDGQILLEGNANSASLVRTFHDRILRAAMFDEVHLHFARQRDLFQATVTHYRLSMRVTRPTEPAREVP